MSENKENFNLIQNIADTVDSISNYMQQKAPNMMWTVDIQQAYWKSVAEAKANGKKVIYGGACAPVELFYAFDTVPFLLDMIPTRIASQPELAGKYIDIAEKHVCSSMCAIDKVDLGAILSGDMPEKPDAFVYTSVPCDSSRVAYPYIAEHLGVPSYCMDVPYRKDERSYRYMAEQYKEIVVFLERITGKKLDWDKFAEVMEISNKTNILMKKIADLRKNTPCPLPGKLLVLNEMIPTMVGSPDMLKYLEAQYALGKYMVAKGLGAVKEEKFRVTWLQNMLWSNTGILDWMEKKYGAVLVMDGFGYQETALFKDYYDQEDVFITLAKKGLALPMIHGAAGPVEDYVNMVDNIIEEYNINVSMFVGHVGCKHTWAAGKIIADMVQEKYGMPTLNLDVDAIDGRYKKTEEIKAIIEEYMDTLIENQGKKGN
ncbi:Benzoyl-CoA reductase/2-hydroxyglutaryl-CoA dehydratase subunit, BcrC/BadD/HgdB [Desulfitobacterium dichloroeliminans LMG P-21439]|uniref:Benzoyl-CoA reductase/2-hydroxyglutaryl-CoA dehydratase subunit, BcrC/BadD/HgdB n=1 Tax=Desulfitobacterium dichloroeliminans (strain LMG P-21439 / DCA1) TaxID=871963 RepID=L0F6G6_DESDL|nr:2-hydroxyacyl-CoA dehydratase family protein [Desulfitobacterium dichloroeliminans]AGA68251.1 Benzoyl-CoA reductase/2-hydroxyglutaryl-CoA dehydratase subunit, BcrC/BadD/HgdB [Desulfitobacterium dichloroeliminans LMG P-21439]